MRGKTYKRDEQRCEEEKKTSSGAIKLIRVQMWGYEKHIIEQNNLWFKIEIENDSVVVFIFLHPCDILYHIMKCSTLYVKVCIIGRTILKTCTNLLIGC